MIILCWFLRLFYSEEDEQIYKLREENYPYGQETSSPITFPHRPSVLSEKG